MVAISCGVYVASQRWPGGGEGERSSSQVSRIAGGRHKQSTRLYTSISDCDGYVYVCKFMAPKNPQILPVGTLATARILLGAVMGAAQSAPQALQHCKTHAPSLHSHTMDRLFGKSKEKAPKPTLDDVSACACQPPRLFELSPRLARDLHFIP